MDRPRVAVVRGASTASPAETLWSSLGRPHWLSEPASDSTAVSWSATPRVGQGLAQPDPCLYLASVPGLLVFDVSDPARPVEVGQGQLPMSGYYVDVTDEHVYVTDWNVWGCPNKCSGGLGIFDVLELVQQAYLPLVRSP